MGFFLTLAAVFLTFGPGDMRKLSIHLFVLGLSAVLGVATAASHFAVFFVFFGTITFLAMIGSANFLGYTSLMHHISEAQCRVYFNPANPAQAPSLCNDDGYLQFLRVVSAFSYFVVAATLVLIITATPILSFLDIERGNTSDSSSNNNSSYSQQYNGMGQQPQQHYSNPGSYSAPQAAYYQPTPAPMPQATNEPAAAY